MILKNVEQKEMDTKEYIFYKLIHIKSYEELEISMMIEIRQSLPEQGIHRDLAAKEYNAAFCIRNIKYN